MHSFPDPGAFPPSPASERVEAKEIAGLLASLMDRSLVIRDDATGRFRLLETIRAYGEELVFETGEALALRQRHRDCFVALAVEAEPHLYKPEQRDWLDLLQADHDNLRAALRFGPAPDSLFLDTVEGREASPNAPSPFSEDEALAEADPLPALRLCGALWWFWYVRGMFREGREYLSSVLSRSADLPPSLEKARALNGAGALAWAQGDYHEAESYYEQSLAINLQLGDDKRLASNFHNLAMVSHHRGLHDEARQRYGEAIERCRRAEHKTGEASALAGLGILERDAGNLDRAWELLQEALAINRALGHRTGEAGSLNNLGMVAYGRGDFQEARTLFEQGLAINREMGNTPRQASNLNNLGLAFRALGNGPAARSLHRKALSLWRDAGDRSAIAECLEALGGLTVELSSPERGAVILGAADRLREELGAPTPQADRPRVDRDIETSRKTLGRSAFSAAWRKGRKLALDEALDLAMED